MGGPFRCAILDGGPESSVYEYEEGMCGDT